MQLGLEDYDPLERCFDNFHKNDPCFVIRVSVWRSIWQTDHTH